MTRTTTFQRARRLVLHAGAATLLTGLLPRAHGREPGVELCVDPALAAYGFPPPHPFGTDRQAAFLREAMAAGLPERTTLAPSRVADDAEIARFHAPSHLARVRSAPAAGLAFLDAGDTPVFPGMHEAAARVVGTALDSLARIVAGRTRCSLQPIGGLHHAARAAAAGFCVYNDIGVVIETLRSVHGIERIAYVDIDAHHGDGVFYAYEDDPALILADLHQDSRTLYPGSGRPEETGRGAARGTKLNIELPPGTGDAAFMAAFARVETHLARFEPQFFLFQCGADSLDGDPIAQLALSPAAHAGAARRLLALARRYAGGRLMAFGGGGYRRDNLARAWTAVLRELLA
jgi:acetoin utilization protein AcuC